MVIEVKSDEFFFPSDAYQYSDTLPTKEWLEATFGAKMAMINEWEPYKLGLKPWAVRIDDGAYAGSILRLKTNLWSAQGLGYSRGGDHNSVAIRVNKEIRTHNNSVYYTCGISGHMTLNRYNNNSNAFIHLINDEGKVYKELFQRTSKTILLDYDGPTKTIYTKKKKEEKPVVELPKFFVDLLGNKVEPGDFAVYVNYDYKRLQIVKFLGYRTRTRAFFIPVGGEHEFYKENVDMIKVELDSVTDTYLRLTDSEATLSDFICQSLPKFALKALTDEVADATDGEQEEVDG